jgi:hypothetical protein
MARGSNNDSLAAVIDGSRLPGFHGHGVAPVMTDMQAGEVEDSVITYETAIKSDKFLVVAHGTADEVQRAKSILEQTGPRHSSRITANPDVLLVGLTLTWAPSASRPEKGARGAGT